LLKNTPKGARSKLENRKLFASEQNKTKQKKQNKKKQKKKRKKERKKERKRKKTPPNSKCFITFLSK